jgi:hypothetical protein
LTRRTGLTRTIATRTRFTSGTTGAFGTSWIAFFANLTRMTRGQSTDVGERIFQTFLTQICSGQVLKITRVAIQTIDGTHFIHVLANLAIQTSVIAWCILMLSFVAIFTCR